MIQLNIWDLLDKKNMNLAQLVKLTWIPNDKFKKMINGKFDDVDVSMIEKILEAFDCEPNDLILYTKNKPSR